MDPVHHGYKPFGVSHAEVDAVCDGTLLEIIGHIANVFFFNIIEFIHAVKICLSTDGRPLVRDSKTNPFKALVDYDVGVDHSFHVVDVVVCL